MRNIPDTVFISCHPTGTHDAETVVLEEPGKRPETIPVEEFGGRIFGLSEATHVSVPPVLYDRIAARCETQLVQ